MPIAPSEAYAMFDLGVFEERDSAGEDYASECKFVDDPHSLDLDLSQTGFRSGTEDYLAQVQLAQADSANSGISYSHEPMGERIKNGAKSIFTMENVEAFNEGVETVRAGLVQAVTNPIPTIKSIALGGWDALNGISEAAVGVTTDDAHERNIERGKVIHQSVVNFENGSVADDVRMGTELVAGVILGEVIVVPLARMGNSVLGYARNITKPDVAIAAKGVSETSFSANNSRFPELPEFKNSDAIKSRSLASAENSNEILRIFTEDGERMVEQPEYSIGDNVWTNGTDLSLHQSDEGLRSLESKVESDPYQINDMHEEPPSPLPYKHLDLSKDSASDNARRLQIPDEITDTTLPKNDREYHSNPPTHALSNISSSQSELLIQHGLSHLKKLLVLM
jgi:hypothetical protein